MKLSKQLKTRKKSKILKTSPKKNSVTLEKYFMKTKKVSLKNILDAYLSTNPDFIPFKAELSRNKLIGFHPSGLHNACARQIAFAYINEKGMFRKDLSEYELTEVDSWITPNLRRIFDTGHVIHMLIQYSYLAGIKRRHKIEVPNKSLFQRYMIGGTSDVLMELQDNDIWVIDIKTAKNEVFMKLKEDDYRTVSSGYLIQLLIYMYGLQKLKGGIFFWNKNTGDIKEFYFKFNSLEQIKHFIQPELDIAGLAKLFLTGRFDVKILPECMNQTGRYDKCEYTTVCFRCNSSKAVLGLTKAKSIKELIK